MHKPLKNLIIVTMRFANIAGRGEGWGKGGRSGREGRGSF